MDQTLLTIVLAVGGFILGGVAAAIWAFRQPAPSPKKKSSTDSGDSQQQEV